MKNITRSIVILLILFFCSEHILAQENYATNIKTEISGSDKMLITYDISPKDGARYFNVIILITHNGQKIQANSAYGDYGSKIGSGEEKAIVWYYKNDFEGDVSKTEVDVFAYKESEPQAEFLPKTISNNGYAPCAVSFTNSSADANDYKWDFGDSNSGIRNHSFEKEPSHTYDKGGLYNISLVATNTELGLESTFYYTIKVLEHPPTIADFEYNTSDVEPPFEVVFVDKSTNADVFTWDFGDPGSGNRKNLSSISQPKHKYKAAGTYTISLTVKSSQTGLTNTITKELVLVEPELPASNFVFSLSTDIAPTIAIFKNTSTNANGYKWNFGDPASSSKNESSEESPNHTYNLPGEYEVSLTAENQKTGKSTKYTTLVTVAEPPKPPESRFRIENNNVIAPSTVIFKNISNHSDRYSWDFGDPESGSNNKSAKKDPNHTFSKAGNYKVTLISKSNTVNEIDEFTDIVFVTEAAEPPLAGFSIKADNFIVPAFISFNNTSSNANRFIWDFGDTHSGNDNSSSLKDPTHTFSRAGEFKITLTCTNTESGETRVHTENITVSEPVKLPKAAFVIDSNEEFAPAIVRFKSNSENSESYSWNFGDNASGNDNSSSQENPQHTYSNAGTYKVVLTCGNSESDEISTHSELVIIKEPVVPVAAFAIEAGEAVAPALVKFNNSSSKADSYSWDFGDTGSENNSSSLKDPEHTYLRDGKYQVALTAKNESSGEINKSTKQIIITRPAPPPKANFTYTFNGDVAPVEVVFNNSSINGDQFLWDFGDSGSDTNESKENNPKHIFNNPGNYTISLIVTNSTTGKADVMRNSITIVSEYKTFVHVSGGESSNEIATSVIQEGPDEYLILVNKPEKGSSLLRMNGDGQVLNEEEVESQLFDIDQFPNKPGYVLSGFQDSMLIIQNLSKDMEWDQPVFIEGVESLNRDYSTPKIAVASNGEVGIVGNIVRSGKPMDIWFQKLDPDGVPVPVRGTTFKFMGIKLENELIPSKEGGFALTGYWQEDEKNPKRLMFASVDSAGRGYLKAITAVSNFIGCDIVNSHSGGYGILAAQGSPLDEASYNIVFMIVDLDGGPVSFSGVIHGDLGNSEIQKFPPCLIQTDGGYVIASHSFNGTDYDINVFWIDVSGEMIMKKEVIQLPGNQYATDVIILEDGSYMIIGSQKSGETYDALIIKTDPFGRINPDN